MLLIIALNIHNHGRNTCLKQPSKLQYEREMGDSGEILASIA